MKGSYDAHDVASHAQAQALHQQSPPQRPAHQHSVWHFITLYEHSVEIGAAYKHDGVYTDCSSEPYRDFLGI